MKRKNKYYPPSEATRFLQWFCKYHLFEEIEGDLLERYFRRADKISKLKNDLIFWTEVIGFFRPIFLRANLLNDQFFGWDMFKSNLKFAARNLYKNFFFSSINISGLAAGMACVLFIFFYVQNELSYDSFNEKADRIYQVGVHASFSGRESKFVPCGGKVGPYSQNTFPEVEAFTRIDYLGIYFVRHENKSFEEKNVLFADTNFFQIFSVPLLLGNPEEVLSNPDGVVISRNAASKYFGNEDPIGKALHLNEEKIYKVSGIFENIPGNSHFSADFVISLSNTKGIDEEFYSIKSNYYTYLLLRENVDSEKFKNKFTSAIAVPFKEEMISKTGKNPDDNSGAFWNFELNNLPGLHFNTEYWTGLNPTTSISYIYIFSAIALFILVIASINFINLSTAKSSSRAKEVGIKKVLGLFKSNLISQFLTESILISLISLMLSFVLIELVKPVFFDVIGKTFEFSYFDNPGFGIALVALVIFIGIVAGSFPAFVLSRFSPTDVLKGSMTNVMKKSWFRSSLVVFQFSTSLILIIGTIVIFNQLEFMQNKNLGFEKEQVLIIDNTEFLGEKAKVFRESLIKHPGVLNGTISGFLPVESNRNTRGAFRDGDLNDEKVGPVQWWTVDYDYFETLGINFIKGRNFSREHSTDSAAIIINESALKYGAWEDDVLNHSFGLMQSGYKIHKYNIIGIVDDFHFNSLKNKIKPVIFRLGSHNGNISFKIKDNIHEVVEGAENLWNEILPNQPFSYRFMDEAFNNEYKSEVNLLALFRYFAIIAVVIGCMGLFALSAYTAERRTKEIGIRKVHGASVSNLIFLLSKEFAALVIISVIISSPIAYFIMEGWLQDYAFRISIGAGTFMLAALSALVIAVSTVSYHALKVSLVNPVTSLKYE